MAIRMNRISVIGTSGSGMTTFVDKLAGILRIPHVNSQIAFAEGDEPMAHTAGDRQRLNYGKRD
jgi:adenylate kinase family enzyme